MKQKVLGLIPKATDTFSIKSHEISSVLQICQNYQDDLWHNELERGHSIPTLFHKLGK